jgi:hypothetical protein
VALTNVFVFCQFVSASKWQQRHDAIESLTSYVESGHLDESSSDAELSASSILLVAREQTRGFKETNVNIMKAILQLLIAICEYCESKDLALGSWAVRDAAAVCVQKISDRKLTALCKSLLTAVCVVSLPSSLLLAAFEELKSVKSPVAHEEFLKWFQTFCTDFGAVSIGTGISDVIPHLLEVSFMALWLLFHEHYSNTYRYRTGTRILEHESKT